MEKAQLDPSWSLPAQQLWWWAVQHSRPVVGALVQTIINYWVWHTASLLIKGMDRWNSNEVINTTMHIFYNRTQSCEKEIRDGEYVDIITIYFFTSCA
jgi:hypothetical protein